MEPNFELNNLRLLHDAEEVEIEVDATPAQPHRVVVWIVTVGCKPYVRSVNGGEGHWYQLLLAKSVATLHADDRVIRVRAVPISDSDTQAEISVEYLRKYAQYPQDAAWMVAPKVCATTLRLEPTL